LDIIERFKSGIGRRSIWCKIADWVSHWSCVLAKCRCPSWAWPWRPKSIRWRIHFSKADWINLGLIIFQYWTFTSF
jgi:hypothetical protein